ncbi:hypothetical protein V8B55DRAFT_1568545 [Mucor lusitanicus]
MGKNVIDWLLIIIIIIRSNKVVNTDINDAASNSAVNQLLLVFWDRKSKNRKKFGVGLTIIIMYKVYFMQTSGAALDEAQAIIVFRLLQDVQVERMISQGQAISTMLE